MREPFFGQNAKPFVVQFIIGIVALNLLYWLFGDMIYNASTAFYCANLGTC